MNGFPTEFVERLESIIPQIKDFDAQQYFNAKPKIAYRVNTLKKDSAEVYGLLRERQILFSRLSWFADAFILTEADHSVASTDWFSQWIEEGVIYRQSASSLLVPVLLDPKPGEMILDLCAAPGSKTTQMSAMMRNEGVIWAVDAVRERYYKLRRVAEILGATNIQFLGVDGRRFRPPQGKLFDKVLVDAPCSTEGRFQVSDPQSYAYWSLRKIKEMVQKQRGLILNGLRCLKPGGVLIYSTCTFAPEENEGIIHWVLRKSKDPFEVETLRKNIPATTYDCLPRWGKKEFDPRVLNCARVLPTADYEGFFIAKLRKE
jgi:16S rRNA (cytosine1407-C5)-methyltransferase